MAPGKRPEGVPAPEYHERTAHTRAKLREASHRLDWENKPIPFKIYEGVPRIELHQPPSLPDEPTLAVLASRTATEAREESLSRGDLGALCHSAVGITKRLELGGREHAFRAAACTGALYHIDLYLVTAPLDDLAAGVYHYDPRDEVLDVLRTGDHRGEVAVATADEPSVAASPAIIVATSTWWRNAWKYGARTFRHAFWDGGTALANLLSVADAKGLDASLTMGFVDERLATLLGLEMDDEAPIALVPVGRGEPTPAPTHPEPIRPGTHPLSPDPVEYPLIGKAHAAGCLADEREVAAWRETVWEPERATSVADEERVSLEPVGPERESKRPLDLTIRRRGSARSYRRDPLSARLLATILDRAVRPIPLDVADVAESPRFSRPYLIVSGVADVPSGSYRFDTVSNELVRLRSGGFRRGAAELALDQRLGADAAVSIYFMADLSELVTSFGDRGYRVAQLEAAILAGRIYLAAYAHRDVGATGLTFYDDDVTEFFSPDAAGRTPMFLLTLGRPEK